MDEVRQAVCGQLKGLIFLSKVSGPDVLKAIRNMEPAWKKVCKSNFRLTSRTIVQPNGGTREAQSGLLIIFCRRQPVCYQGCKMRWP